MAIALALVISGPFARVGAQSALAAAPEPLARLDIRTLAGEWFEVASGGSAWAHRRCTANTRFVFAILDARRLGAVRTCTTPTGVEVRRGRVAGPTDGSGALRARFVPTALAWIPAAWSEYSVLASGPGLDWLLIGNRTRERLAVWSRTVSIDEAALAAAIVAARMQGFDPRQLTAVPQPAGPGPLLPTR